MKNVCIAIVNNFLKNIKNIFVDYIFEDDKNANPGISRKPNFKKKFILFFRNWFSWNWYWSYFDKHVLYNP